MRAQTSSIASSRKSHEADNPSRASARRSISPPAMSSGRFSAQMLLSTWDSAQRAHVSIDVWPASKRRVVSNRETCSSGADSFFPLRMRSTAWW